MNQLLVLPESVEFVGNIAASRRFTLSFTSTYDAVAFVGFTYQREPVDEDRSERFCPEAPVRVNVPATVCVEPASNVKVAALLTLLVRLEKLVDPVIV